MGGWQCPHDHSSLGGPMASPWPYWLGFHWLFLQPDDEESPVPFFSPKFSPQMFWTIPWVTSCVMSFCCFRHCLRHVLALFCSRSTTAVTHSHSNSAASSHQPRYFDMSLMDIHLMPFFVLVSIAHAYSEEISSPDMCISHLTAPISWSLLISRLNFCSNILCL